MAPPEVAPEERDGVVGETLGFPTPRSTLRKEGVVGETMGFPTSEGEPWFPYLPVVSVQTVNDIFLHMGWSRCMHRIWIIEQLL